MGQAGSTQHSEQLLWDEHIARHLQEEEFTDDSIELCGINELELQIARDTELAHYLEANDGVMPPEFVINGPSGQYHWKGEVEDALKTYAIAVKVEDGRRIEGTVTCVACDEPKHQQEALQAPCGDHYCRQCLEHLFRQSLTDEQYFPPRCHKQEILISQAKGLINPDLAANFEAKYVELSTPNRTYCHDVRCNTFIPPQAIHGDVGRCGRCNKSTCALCKGNRHRGDCPQDTALQQLIETAGQQGWRRCQRCSRMIELTHGCNHMTCLCGNQFCYICGRAPWKSCRCNAFDQQRLLYHAEDIVNQGRDIQNETDQQQENGHPAQPIVANQGYQARVNLVAQRVANNHDGCDHPMPWSRYQEGYH